MNSVFCKRYHVIFGTPGSGKTTTVVALIKSLVELGKKILVVSFTNSAVDNILIKLKKGQFNEFVRIANNTILVDKCIHSNIKTC